MVTSKNDKCKAVDVGGLIDLVKALLPQEVSGASKPNDGAVPATNVKVETCAENSDEEDPQNSFHQAMGLAKPPPKKPTATKSVKTEAQQSQQSVSPATPIASSQSAAPSGTAFPAGSDEDETPTKRRPGRPRQTINISAQANSAESDLASEYEALLPKVEAFYSLSEVMEDPVSAKDQKVFKAAQKDKLTKITSLTSKITKAVKKAEHIPSGVQASLDTTRELMQNWQTDLELLTAVTSAVRNERVNLAQFAEWMPKLRHAKFTLSSTYKSQFLVWIADDSFRLHKWGEWAGTFSNTQIHELFGQCSKGTDAALFALETILFRTVQDVQAQDCTP